MLVILIAFVTERIQIDQSVRRFDQANMNLNINVVALLKVHRSDSGHVEALDDILEDGGDEDQDNQLERHGRYPQEERGATFSLKFNQFSRFYFHLIKKRS